MTLTILRHGEEEQPECLHGWQDVPLTRDGVLQAEHAAKRLAAHDYRHAYTSDLQRAAVTAAVVVGPHVQLVAQNALELRSLNLGLLQGRPFKEVGDEVNALWNAWGRGEEDLRAPEGESWRDFQGRVYPFLHALHECAGAGVDDVLAVTHSHVVDYACAVAANGGRPLYGNALGLVKRFTVNTGDAAEFRDGRLARLNYIR
jgi:alpha-ribazole phosphatase